MTEIGSVIAGKYEILKEVGHGGMSVVYLAIDTHLNRNWAVKEVRKTGKTKNDEIIENSILVEANLIKRLDHPALPRIVDIIDNGETIYIVMDFIEGESLDKVLTEYGAQPEEKVIEWAMQVCDVLSYLHSQKPPIIYRDMKPGNLMLKPNGNICIIDFGIAREYKEENLADTKVLGTKGYAPPEQYNGQTDPRSDIYALGMTMHQLLTGVDPTSGEQYASVRYWNPNLSEGIEAIINKCVEPAAENRYQNCQELLLDLQDPEKVTRGWKKLLKKRLAAFIAVGALSAAFAVGGIMTNLSAKAASANNYDIRIKNGDYYGAIEIDKGRIDAYQSELERLLLAGSSVETKDYLKLRDRLNESGLNPKTNDEVADLYYDLGKLLLTDEKETSFTIRANKALACFNAIKGNDSYPKKDLVQAYCNVIGFLNKQTKYSARQKTDYTDFLDDIDNVIMILDTLTDEDSDFEKATYYYTVLMTIRENVRGFKRNGVSQERLTALISEKIVPRVEQLTAQINTVEELKEKIVNQQNTYLQLIAIEYGNVR